ncbi:MAG: DUF3303 family protein [Armatimonadetes bacterium]|nr:DUF3303 family protein [Armatimonadota bacterium]
MHYMVVERFRAGEAAPVYRRFAERGRLAPEGLEYISSWVNLKLGVCYQVMACDDPSLLQSWMANWEDLVEFEVVPVVTSAEAASTVSL